MQYEHSDRVRELASGGIGSMHHLAQHTGLVETLDHLPRDTDFSQTQYLDGWDTESVRFVFDYDAPPECDRRRRRVAG